MSQTEIINLENLVPINYIYRKFVKLWSFRNVEKRLSKIEIDNNNKGYRMLRLLEKNKAAKWFCNFRLSE